MRCPYRLLICLLAGLSTTAFKTPARAQITPDQTLGAESSVIRSGVAIDGEIADLIEGGATRGENLFHSFSDFNVDSSAFVYFDSPVNIETILSRVTGSDLSNINGLLGTTGDSNAALVLMNPNGIVFGEDASLNTQGAFAATTATSIQLGENGLFSAVTPDRDQLLSVSPSTFFFNELENVSSGISVDGAQLQMENGEALLLIGRDIAVDSSSISAPNSRVEIVAVGDAAAARVGEDGAIALGEVERGRISVENGSLVDVRSPQGGTLILVANDIQVLSGSQLLAGVLSSPEGFDLNRLENSTNSIALDATGTVQIAGSGTFLQSGVLIGASGQSEGVSISADSIEITENAVVNSITLGEGSAGSVVLEADSDILIEGASVTSSVEAGGAGQGGDIFISGERIDIRGAALLGTFTSGAGNAGDLNIAAIDKVELSGAGRIRPFLTSITSSEEDSGDITISSARFKSSGDVAITAASLSTGTVGDISISAAQEAVFGSERSAEVIGILSSNVGEQALKRGGDIEIISPVVEVLNGFQISTGTFGEVDASNIKIQASDLIRIDGFSTSPDSPSSTVGSLAVERSSGRAGIVEVISDRLEVTNGGVIGSSTSGTGDAGAVRVEIEGTAIFDGFNPRRPSASSGIRSSTSRSSGRGGEIFLSATNLDVTGGAQLIAASSGKGDAGEVVVDVSDSIRLDGINLGTEINPSSIGSEVLDGGTGNGGSVRIAATNLEITNGAEIGADTSGLGNAGDVFVSVAEFIRVDGVSPVTGSSPSSISGSIQPDGVGKGGNVVVLAENIEISNGGQIDTSVFGIGEAGNVTLNVSETIRIDGVNAVNEMSPSSVGSGIQSTQLGEENRGGSVTITTNNLEITNGGAIDALTFGRGDAGRIVINASGTVRLDGVAPADGVVSSLIVSSVQPNAIGNGGSIEINAAELAIENGAQIDTSVFGVGEAGDITLNIDGDIRVDGKDLITGETPSSIGSGVADEGRGNGGSLNIASTNLYIAGGAQIAAANTAQGNAGSIFLNVGEQLRVEEEGNIATRSLSGSGGEIIIQADSVILRRDGDIRTLVEEGEGTSGDLTINADYIVALDDSDMLAFSVDGRGGDVDLSQPVLFGQELNAVSEELDADALNALDQNGRVDINASGGITSGQILLNDASFIEEDLAELPSTLVDTDSLIANACIAESRGDISSFVVRGSDRTPLTPNDPLSNVYSLSAVQPLSEAQQSLQEPEAIYQTSDGRLLISHRCQN